MEDKNLLTARLLVSILTIKRFAERFLARSPRVCFQRSLPLWLSPHYCAGCLPHLRAMKRRLPHEDWYWGRLVKGKNTLNAVVRLKHLCYYENLNNDFTLASMQTTGGKR